MQAERILLETDDEGNLICLPKLPPNRRLEAIFLLLDEAEPRPAPKRTPHAQIAGKGETLGDLVGPIVDTCTGPCQYAKSPTGLM